MFGKILIATDGSESNKVAVEDGLELARKMVAEAVVAVAVFDAGGYAGLVRDSTAENRELVMKAADGALAYARDRAEALGVDMDTKILCGHPAEVVTGMSGDFDLVVCGTSGKTGVERALLGLVAEKTVRMSKCPVLVCRNPVKP